MSFRKSRQVETRMVSEFLARDYSGFINIQAIPLGQIDKALQESQGTAKAIGYSRPFRPVADAAVILPNHIVLIEAKVWQVMNGLGKLPMYKALIPFTPELAPFMPREVIMELVVAKTDANLELMARSADIRLKLYCPDWLQEIIDGMNNYWTAEYHQKRQDVLALREYFGIE